MAIKPLKKISNITDGSMPAALRPKLSDHGTKVVFETPRYDADRPECDAKHRLSRDIPRYALRATRDERVEEKVVKKETKKLEKIKEVEKVEKVVAETKVVVPTEIEDMKELAIKNILKDVEDNKKIVERREKIEPKKSLLSLSKCFLDSDRGNSCLMRHGSNKFPGLEEMKYICYEKQIEDHIINTWRMLHGGVSLGGAGKVSITFLINQDGKVEELQLIESSRNKMFDDMVLKCIRNTVFPPIPKHLGVAKYRPRGGLTMLPGY